VPVVESDVTSGFVNENEEIDLSDPTLGSVQVTVRKLASLTRLSRQAAEDSDPASAVVVGDSISRDLAFKTDMAFIAASTAKGPVGLGSLVGNGAQAVDVVGAIGDLDPFVSAIGKLEAHGAQATCFIADSRTWTGMALLRQFDGATQSNLPFAGR
jgi:HK97 family phage major capsid protein